MGLFRYYFSLLLFLFVLWTISCSGRTGKEIAVPGAVGDQPSSSTVAARLIKIVQPEENAELKLNAEIKVILAPDNQSDPPDSVMIWYDNFPAGLIKSAPWEITIPSSSLTKTGRRPLKVVAYGKEKKIQTVTRFIVIYSDIVPVRYGYRVINTFPHDTKAFTQGLVFDNGYLYEGTGRETQSSLRKVNLVTGEVLNQLNLDSQLFGEGIAILGERIYQLTWQSKVGFVYEKSTFKQLNKIYYQTEGWGLTAMGNKLLMSDGSNILYIVDPEMFTVDSRIEVYDNNARVMNLNELEYINGEIWANIWQTDLIARIDPGSGRVNSIVDLKGLLKNGGAGVDVLNGIAWDEATGRIFVTGKNWPSLFEIKVTE